MVRQIVAPQGVSRQAGLQQSAPATTRPAPAALPTKEAHGHKQDIRWPLMAHSSTLRHPMHQHRMVVENPMAVENTRNSL